jgi:hypothetical protein
MSKKSMRTTMYLEPALHKSLRLRAAESSCSMSELVNRAVRAALNDDGAILAVSHEGKTEAQISFDKMVEQLKKDGFIEADN